jgi:hypothetical protein
MTHYETAVEEFVTSHELNGLAKATGPCITATVTIPDPAHLRPEINRTIRELERRLKIAVPDVRTAQTLLEPLREFASTVETDGDWAVALVIYRSPEVFRCFRVPAITKELAAIENNFEMGPLLPVVSRDQRFHLLALSQKKVRLFDCSHYRIREVELHGRVPQNLRVFLNDSVPDHVLDNRSSAGPSVGAMKGVMFGTGTDREKHDEYLTHFFHEVDKGLHKILAGDNSPLLLAGVEYEIALYQRITRFPRVLKNSLHGSPDAIRSQQLYEGALGIVRNSFSVALEKLMSEFPRHRDAERVTFALNEILDASTKGRVSHLLVQENAEDPKLNLAALQTLTHGGEVYALHDSEMPDHADIAAVTRY